MPIEPDVIFKRGLDVFGDVVDRVDATEWSAPSPCEGWTALDVLGHLGTAIQFGVAAMQGVELEWKIVDHPGVLVDGEPTDYWARTSTQAKEALEGTDLSMEVDTPMGKQTIANRLAFPAVDLFVHAWDIGKATKLVVEVPDDVIAFGHAYIDAIPSEMVRGSGMVFGSEVEPPSDATPTECFIAWTGRNPR